MKELVAKMVECYGPSGHERNVRCLIEEQLAEQISAGKVNVRTDAMGNLVVHREGKGKRVMLAAHMDEIGLIVTHVDEKGFLRFAAVGGVSPLTLIGSRIRFADGVVGVLGWEKWLQETTLPNWGELFADVGATSRSDCPVSIGDVACFLHPFEDLGGRLVAKAMDDRIGCAVVLQTLLDLEDSLYDVYVVFTVQEEVGTRGATVATFGIRPDVALAIDVTPVRDTPEARPVNMQLGQGPAIKLMDAGMLAHPGVKEWMVHTAERIGIPYQLEVLERGGTDARAMQLSREGIPAGCLSIPCRYVHTPSEMVDYTDVTQAKDLLRSLLSTDIDI